MQVAVISLYLLNSPINEEFNQNVFIRTWWVNIPSYFANIIAIDKLPFFNLFHFNTGFQECSQFIVHFLLLITRILPHVMFWLTETWFAKYLILVCHVNSKQQTRHVENMPLPEEKSRYDGPHQRLQNIASSPRPVTYGVLVFYFGRLCRLLKDLIGNGITSE